MDMNRIYAGLDVDVTQYHGSALTKHIGEVITFQCRPTLAGLVKQLAKLDQAFPDNALSPCYEASYVGYTLQRDLVEHGYHYDVVATSGIPSPRSLDCSSRKVISSVQCNGFSMAQCDRVTFSISGACAGSVEI